MSVLKSELKQLVTHEVGVRVEDALEAAKKELATLEGRQGAFTDGSKAVEALLPAVDKEVEEGKFDLEAAALVKRYLTRATNALTNLSQQAMNYRIAQTGKVAGLDQTVQMLKNMVEAERAKAEAVKQAAMALGKPPEAPGVAPAVPAGMNRPMSIKERRLAEEAAAAAAQAVPPPSPETAPSPEAEPVTKRRGKRKPRAANS